jgi:mono/diheme cytochrome c family protein
MRLFRITGVAIFLFACCSLAYGEAPAAYSAQCASCHGADGRGKTNGAFKDQVPDLHSKKVQDLSDDELYDTIARGTKHRVYPHAYLYRGLKQIDIRDLVKYIRTLGTEAK